MTINIPLIDGYRILSDKYQYILAREDGERIFYEGFYSEIGDCVQAFVNKKIRSFDSTSIHSLMEAIKMLQARVSKALQPLKLRVVQDIIPPSPISTTKTTTPFRKKSLPQMKALFFQEVEKEE